MPLSLLTGKRAEPRCPQSMSIVIDVSMSIVIDVTVHSGVESAWPPVGGHHNPDLFTLRGGVPVTSFYPEGFEDTERLPSEQFDSLTVGERK